MQQYKLSRRLHNNWDNHYESKIPDNDVYRYSVTAAIISLVIVKPNIEW